jgi:hypothetical protein
MFATPFLWRESRVRESEFNLACDDSRGERDARRNDECGMMNDE